MNKQHYARINVYVKSFQKQKKNENRHSQFSYEKEPYKMSGVWNFTMQIFKDSIIEGKPNIKS